MEKEERERKVSGGREGRKGRGRKVEGEEGEREDDEDVFFALPFLWLSIFELNAD